MRPNIDIPHALNGRVRDLVDDSEEYATVDEAYADIIEHGLAAIAGDDGSCNE